jgi:hypothetical protein
VDPQLVTTSISLKLVVLEKGATVCGYLINPVRATADPMDLVTGIRSSFNVENDGINDIGTIGFPAAKADKRLPPPRRGLADP